MSRRPTGKIAALKFETKRELNRRLLDGWHYDSIAEWMIEKGHAAAWIGEPLNRKLSDDDRAKLIEAIKQAVYRWHKGPYLDWLKENAQSDVLVRVTERIQASAESSADRARVKAPDGMIVQMSSLLLETLEKIYTGEKDPAALASLAFSINALLGTQVKREALGLQRERLDHQRQTKVEAGLKAIETRAGKDPNVRKAVEQIRAAVKGKS